MNGVLTVVMPLVLVLFVYNYLLLILRYSKTDWLVVLSLVASLLIMFAVYGVYVREKEITELSEELLRLEEHIDKLYNSSNVFYFDDYEDEDNSITSAHIACLLARQYYEEELKLEVSDCRIIRLPDYMPVGWLFTIKEKEGNR